MDKRQIKLGFRAFLIVFFISLFTLKPYLGRAIYHNFAGIYDYQIFENRQVRVQSAKPDSTVTADFSISEKKLPDPDSETLKMLTDLDTTALLVLENGQIVYEKYFLSGSKDQISNSFSVAKSIVSLLVGIAIDDRKIGSVQDRVELYLPEWSERPEGKITIEQLLQMTSGLNWSESYWNPFSITAEAYYGQNLMQTIFKQRLIRESGTVFDYQSGSTNLLGVIVARATNQNLSDYASQKLWKKIGAQSEALWSLDHENGIEKSYCCFHATARDFARIGQLVLQNGKWNGEQVVSENYIQKMIAPHQIPDKEQGATGYYAYQWWVLRTDQGFVPYARGILGQVIAVLPQKNRVIVRLGMKTGKRENHHPVELSALVRWGLNL